MLHALNHLAAALPFKKTNAIFFPAKFQDELTQYVHSTTNLLVDARMSLFVIYPGLAVHGNVMSFSASEADVDVGESISVKGLRSI